MLNSRGEFSRLAGAELDWDRRVSIPLRCVSILAVSLSLRAAAG